MPDSKTALLAFFLLAAATASAVPAQTPTPTAAATPLATIDAPTRKQVIDTAIARMTQSYVFPEKVPMIAKALRTKLASGGYGAATDPKTFAAAVSDDIEAVAHDRHMRLFWSADPLPPLGEAGKADPKETARRADLLARINYAIPRIEVLDGNIGYLKIDNFMAAEDAGPTFAAAMAFLKHTDAMIFDLRENGGGDPGMVAMAVSYLVPPETHINSFHQRGKPIDDQVWALPFVPGGRWSIEKPVYVLTSKETGSGAEEFASDMQQLKRGTVIGGVTWGGANPGDVIAIDQHFAIFVPTGAAVNPVSKTNWEGVGVKPDVAVDPAAALDTARRMAFDRLMASATPERRVELEKLRDAKPNR